MNTIAEFFDDILVKIKNPNLKHPLFYNSPIGIRFEIGAEVPIFLEVEESKEKVLNQAYIELALQRAKTIYDELPQPPNLLRIDIYPNEIERKNKHRSVMSVLHQILPPPHEQRRINIDREEEKYMVVQLYWDLSKINISPELLLKETIKADLGGISALASNVYFANKEEVFVFHIYDDRGADLVAQDKETLYPIYQTCHQWILDYDRENIDILFLG